jgi:PIN domain nuclease of toxin-antitoxin system
VQAKLVSRGWTVEDAWEDGTSPIREVVALDGQHPKRSHSLVAETQQLGLSLGERDCLGNAAQRSCIYRREELEKAEIECAGSRHSVVAVDTG